jgi:hypothetical protein
MNLLPLAGLIAGVVIGTRLAFVATCALAALGLVLVALFTSEIDGAGDPYMWGIVIVSLVFTAAGIGIRRWYDGRRAPVTH